MKFKKFDLRKRLQQEAEKINDRLIEKIGRSVFLQAFLIEDLMPWLEYAKDASIQAEYESTLNGNAPTHNAEAFEALQLKLERLLNKALPANDKEQSDG